MEGFALLMFCVTPLLIFAAGWFACYFLTVKYRIRFEAQGDHTRPVKAIREKGWQP